MVAAAHIDQRPLAVIVRSTSRNDEERQVGLRRKVATIEKGVKTGEGKRRRGRRQIKGCTAKSEEDVIEEIQRGSIRATFHPSPYMAEFARGRTGRFAWALDNLYDNILSGLSHGPLLSPFTLDGYWDPREIDPWVIWNFYQELEDMISRHIDKIIKLEEEVQQVARMIQSFKPSEAIRAKRFSWRFEPTFITTTAWAALSDRWLMLNLHHSYLHQLVDTCAQVGVLVGLPRPRKKLRKQAELMPRRRCTVHRHSSHLSYAFFDCLKCFKETRPRVLSPDFRAVFEISNHCRGSLIEFPHTWTTRHDPYETPLEIDVNPYVPAKTRVWQYRWEKLDERRKSRRIITKLWLQLEQSNSVFSPGPFEREQGKKDLYPRLRNSITTTSLMV